MKNIIRVVYGPTHVAVIPYLAKKISCAIERRLNEEMGMQCQTDFAFSFIYKSNLANGLTEHEFDHVYFGISDELPFPEKSEVKNWSYITLENLAQEILHKPEKYTEWLKICLPKVKTHFENSLKNNLLEYASI
jgi:isopentenyl-diphosphate delta-isomerase